MEECTASIFRVKGNPLRQPVRRRRQAGWHWGRRHYFYDELLLGWMVSQLLFMYFIVCMIITVFRVVTPCARGSGTAWRFRGTYHLHLQGWRITEARSSLQAQLATDFCWFLAWLTLCPLRWQGYVCTEMSSSLPATQRCSLENHTRCHHRCENVTCNSHPIGLGTVQKGRGFGEEMEPETFTEGCSLNFIFLWCIHSEKWQKCSS
jgi:hypothetical protein